MKSKKTCYCYTCGRMFHYLGIARHRAMHRDKMEVCTIEYSDGEISTYWWTNDLKASKAEVGQ